MSDRTPAPQTEELAHRFEQINDEIIATIEPLSEAQWRTRTPGEQWSIAVVAHHAATGYTGITGLVQMVAAGQPVPLTPERLEHGNARHAVEHAECTKEETLAILRSEGARAAGVVRSLSPEQLERSGVVLGQPMTTQQVVEYVLIGHPRGHLQSIQSTLAS